MEDITMDQHKQIGIELAKSGLDLIDNKKAVLIEKTVDLIKEMARNPNELSQTDPSAYISEKIKCDYTFLSDLFSEGRGITIENFISNQKIERVKELIIYTELSLKEIAWKMHYNTVAQLSSHFKTSTGLTLSHFRKLNIRRQILIEEVQNF